MIKLGDNYVWNETYVSERNTTITPLASGATTNRNDTVVNFSFSGILYQDADIVV